MQTSYSAVISPAAPSAAFSTASSRARSVIWTGRILSTIPVLFLLFDSTAKVVNLAPVREATVQLGYPVEVTAALGALELLCLIAHLIPRTTVIGAVLLTGYLGGAVASHVRLEDPLFTHVLFPVYVAALLWGGLFVRRPRVADAFLP